MPNIGFPEMLIILVIALLVFGPKKLPQMGRSMGKSMREFKQAVSGAKSQLTDEEEEPDKAPAATAPENGRPKID